MLTSIMAASGVHVGESLVPADQHNRKGYFEDVDFLSLNRRMLSECCDANDGGHPDWGWTESETLDRSRFSAYRD
ncbi:MAG: sulfotransferase family protein, partial [Acidobacteriota bacterium]